MWLDYSKERFGYRQIEEDWGFVCYTIAKPFIAIQEMYVKPEVRKGQKGTNLLNKIREIGKTEGCSHVWAQVWLSDFNCNETLGTMLRREFRLTEAHNNRIILTREIGEV